MAADAKQLPPPSAAVNPPAAEKAPEPATVEKPAPPIEEPAPETYEVKHGPFSTRELALKKRDELMAHNGFPMLKTSHITEGKIGKDFPVFYLQTVMRNRFPPPGKWKPNFVDDKEVPVAARGAAAAPAAAAAKEPEFYPGIAEALKALESAADPKCVSPLLPGEKDLERICKVQEKLAEANFNFLAEYLNSSDVALALLRIVCAKGYVASYIFETCYVRFAIALDHERLADAQRYMSPTAAFKRFDPKQTAL